MAGWTTHQGRAVVLERDNIDTDQLIPARFMSVPRADGYGPYLLHDLRRDAGGTLREDFPLNRHETVSVLVAGRNFGSGSSREAAVYALVDAGISAVLAPGFGDIFASNAVNNGLLPGVISETEHAALMAQMDTVPHPVEIDVQARRAVVAGHALTFTLPETWAAKLINGWDDIDLTQQHAPDIADYAAERKRMQPWCWPG